MRGTVAVQVNILATTREEIIEILRDCANEIETNEKPTDADLAVGMSVVIKSKTYKEPEKPRIIKI